MSDESHCEVDFDDASDDADPVQFYDEKIVRGRKAHTCTECGADIAIGEEHQRKSYRFEGTFHCDRICAACQEAAGEFSFRMVGGMLWESFWNEWDNGANLQGCLNRLASVRAKTTMRDQWQRWQEKRAEQRKAYAERLRARSGTDAGSTP